jgi:hypothetical protein
MEITTMTCPQLMAGSEPAVCNVVAAGKVAMLPISDSCPTSYFRRNCQHYEHENKN